jgi:hypothetical protein
LTTTSTISWKPLTCKPGQREVVMVVMEVKSDSSHFTPVFRPYNTHFIQYKYARINTRLSKSFARFRFDHHHLLEPLTTYMQTRSARGSGSVSGSQTRKPRYLTPDQLRAAVILLERHFMQIVFHVLGRSTSKSKFSLLKAQFGLLNDGF